MRQDLPERLEQLVYAVILNQRMFIEQVAAEACRLQREQDYRQYSGECNEALESSKLIVEMPE